MGYLSVAEIAARWGVSPRTVRNYCANGRIPGAFLTGKTWNIPDNAQRPARATRNDAKPRDLLDFHVRFERVHPFQDGNGRVRRLLLFRECLRWGIVPFIIDGGLKAFYYRGLAEWDASGATCATSASPRRTCSRRGSTTSGFPAGVNSSSKRLHRRPPRNPSSNAFPSRDSPRYRQGNDTSAREGRDS